MLDDSFRELQLKALVCPSLESWPRDATHWLAMATAAGEARVSAISLRLVQRFRSFGFIAACWMPYPQALVQCGEAHRLPSRRVAGARRCEPASRGLSHVNCDSPMTDLAQFWHHETMSFCARFFALAWRFYESSHH